MSARCSGMLAPRHPSVLIPMAHITVNAPVVLV